MAVYFVRNTENGCIKIGMSGAPMSRLRQLQTASPHKLELMGIIEGGPDEERRLHDRFAGLRMEGEWFRGDPEMVDGIRGLIRSQENGADDGACLKPMALWRVEGVEESGSTASNIVFYVFTESDVCMPDPKKAFDAIPGRAPRYQLALITKIEQVGIFEMPDDCAISGHCGTDVPPVNLSGNAIPPEWLSFLLFMMVVKDRHSAWISDLQEENSELSERVLGLMYGTESQASGPTRKN